MYRWLVLTTTNLPDHLLLVLLDWKIDQK